MLSTNVQKESLILKNQDPEGTMVGSLEWRTAGVLSDENQETAMQGMRRRGQSGRDIQVIASRILKAQTSRRLSDQFTRKEGHMMYVTF